VQTEVTSSLLQFRNTRLATFYSDSESLIVSPTLAAGDPKLHALLASVHARFGCVPLAHIQDACDAHIFLMDAPAAEGRYLCAGGSRGMAQIARLLSSHYPPFKPAERQAIELWFVTVFFDFFSDLILGKF
jgi:nucleoside-diphosphate-sugar epimerase